MKRIIELTLDGSRDIPTRTEQAPIDATIQGAVEANREQARSKGVTIDYRRSGEALLVAHDPVQLERAISNLIRNGIEAAEQPNKNMQEKTVRISTENEPTGVVSVRLKTRAQDLATILILLFKPTKSNKPHGAGLGLISLEKLFVATAVLFAAGHSEATWGSQLIPCRCPSSPLRGHLYDDKEKPRILVIDDEMHLGLNRFP
jgi:signal transduction histidine kinase